MRACQAMLMQTDGEKIFLLPAWPADWDCEFKLHAPHKTTVEGRVRGGKVVDLKVTPESRRKDVVLSAAAFPVAEVIDKSPGIEAADY